MDIGKYLYEMIIEKEEKLKYLEEKYKREFEDKERWAHTPLLEEIMFTKGEISGMRESLRLVGLIRMVEV